jgi:hypothetical protein
MVRVVPSQNRVKTNGQPVLLMSDTTLVTGCAFTVASKPQPCVTVKWSAAATRVTVAGTAPILSTSIGICQSAEGVPQGTVLIAGVQTKAGAT